MSELIKKTFTLKQVQEMLESAQEIDSGAWRHGRRVTYVLTDTTDEAHYVITIDVHSDEGQQLYGLMFELYQVEQVEQVEKMILVWEPKLSS